MKSCLNTTANPSILAAMDERFRLESEKLKLSWMQHDKNILGSYLVEDVQDPRINVQSILCRGWLLEQLFGDKYSYIAEHEVRFGLVMNWLKTLHKKNVRLGQLQAVLYALIEKQSTADGIEIPPYVSQTFAALEMPNYMCDLFNWAPQDIANTAFPEYLVNTFGRIWSELLEQEQSQTISVLEPACGSANDYRFLESFGIAKFLDYTGFDLCNKNIANAKTMFQNVKFNVDNALEINARDKSFDYCFVHDLFEHFSIEAMELAVREVCRVTRKGIWAGFFNMHPGAGHIVKPVEDYHWNKLSAPETARLFEQQGGRVEVINIDEFLTTQFACSDTHNKNAYVFIINF
jgi:ubiquinone/menaquinone biosynthesis C-methylase UbiE